MGNPAWGNGFHKGIGKGRIQGVIIGVAFSAATAGVAAGRQWLTNRRAQATNPAPNPQQKPGDAAPGSAANGPTKD